MTDRGSHVLESVLATLTTAAENLTLPHAVALITVASKPGLSVNDLAYEMGVPQQTASRHVAVLLGRYQDAISPTPKTPLIAQEVSADDPRKRALFVTPEGSKVIRRIIDPIEKLVDQRGDQDVGC